MYFRLNPFDILLWLLKTMLTTRGWILFYAAATTFFLIRFIHAGDQLDLLRLVGGAVGVVLSSYLYISYRQSSTCDSCHYNRVDCLTRSLAQQRLACLDRTQK